MITLKNLSFGYGKKQVLDSVNLNFERGCIYGILGENGVGKTTLMRLLCGLLFPNSGEVLFEGENTSSRKPSVLSKIFFIPEEFELPNISIRKYAQIYGKFYPNFSNELFERIVSEFSVEIDLKMNKMSFGQRKKAYISFAIACQTPLVVMDEPTNGLDIPSKGIFRKIISSVIDQSRTIIISTHQVRDLDNMIDNIVIVKDMHIALDAAVSEIAKKLSFRHFSDSDLVFYKEKRVDGDLGVVKNRGNEEGAIDIEMLFNAVVQNPDILKVFNNL